MAQNQKHFDEFKSHTLLKHTVLSAYLQTWARKMLLRSGATRELCIVDACAGAGRDAQGNAGSPVLAATVAEDAERHLQSDPQLQKGLTGPLRIDLVAIEKESKHYRALVENLKPYERRARPLRGTLADYIEEHFSLYCDTPTLFFVDPFGLAPLRADVIRRALTGPRNEVLLLFADQAALRHFGAATAAMPDLEAEIAASTPTQLGIFEAPEVQLQRAREEATKRVLTKTAALQGTKPRVVEILNAAFGGEGWRPVIEGTPQQQRRARFLEMYIDLLRGFGAAYVLPLPMRNTRNQHVYTLIHATQSVHGYTAMKTVVSSALNKASLSEEAVENMRFQIRSDLDEIETEVRRKFAGRSVPWTDQKDGRPNIRQFVLEETPAFDFELKELKLRLKKEKRRGHGPEIYTFP